MAGSNVCAACAGATRTLAAATPSSRSSSVRTSSSTRQSRFAPGQLLGGRYRIIAMLGKGGMGEVYRADDLSLDQPVALKFLPEALTHHEEALARFRNEVRIARQVSHPNVCRVYDLGEMEGLYFLSMEYVDGEDLGSLLRRIGRLPTDKAIEIARKLCAGLSAAHEKGVLHRDLKPSNIMLDSRGQVLLTDFGLAGLAGEIEGAEVRNGTPAYMAPEQLAGEEVTIKSDLYSLGLVLYEIFTGRLPYESTTLAGLMRAQKESQPPSPATLVRDLDPMVERVILRCLQARPALRPSSALAVAAALPGGDPLAAALAAGETPSPEMVAAAGEGEGVSLRVAVGMFAAAVVLMIAGAALFNRSSALEMLKPEYPPEVLQQKARDMLPALGVSGSRRADYGSGFRWNSGSLDEFRKHHKPGLRWDRFFAQKPEALMFWYRQAESSMTGLSFHDDLLTPGMLQWDDPPPTESGMVGMKLDSYGRLAYFERIPEQLQEPLKDLPQPPNWGALFALAGLDIAQFQPAEPLWNSLASSDTRVAWAGVWPGTTHPLRVEAASLRNRPVFFSVVEAWTKPDRSPSPAGSAGDAITLTIFALVAITVGLGAGILASRNLSAGRGDRRGAWRLGLFFACVQMALWLARGHFPASFGTFGMLLVALCTSVFYGVVIWTLYIALEPYVRRRWPQTLISWSSLLIGKFSDPVVGRDVLVGVTAGAAVSLLGAVVDFWGWQYGGGTPSTPATQIMEGLRGTLAYCTSSLSHGIREALMFFFLIFLFRVLLRNQWLAAAAFAGLFSSLNFVSGDHPIMDGTVALLVLGAFAFLVLRWGLLSLSITIVTVAILSEARVTTDAAQWYFGNYWFLIAVIAGLAIWALRTAIGGRQLLRS
jgi:hypothetical protein